MRQVGKKVFNDHPQRKKKMKGSQNIYYNIICTESGFWYPYTPTFERCISVTRVPKNMYPVRTEHETITAHSVQLLAFCTAHACLSSVSRLVTQRLNPKFHPLHTCINNSV